ncbi:MAG: acyl-CoA dehydrogenase family protein [Gammaproteobacteria bacterium]|nr:acyl-CoA dehydrogenase family protein [Gammaproteobacteria bacterium]
MNFEFTTDQKTWFDAAVQFATKQLGGDMVEKDRNQEFDRARWQACADFGVLGMGIPEEYGGTGLGLSDTLAVMEGLGYATRDQGLLFSLNAHLWTNAVPILEYGTEEQKQKYLPGLCSGELIGANGASEPDAGSDIYSLRTSAKKEGDSYRVNGTKMFVTNAQVCDLIVAYATINPALGPLGITALILEKKTPGVSVSRSLEKMGLRTSPMAELIFEDVEIPLSSVLGRAGRGAEVFSCSMEWERGCILANCVGAMQRQLEECIDYARQRKQFGKPISQHQTVANRLVDMRVRIDTCRPLIYKIGWLKDQGHDAVLESSIAKLHVSDCYVKSSMDAIQLFGGYGYMTEQEVERDLRDSISSRLYSGTSDIQRNIIAKKLGL